jgi:hypothetical protein
MCKCGGSYIFYCKRNSECTAIAGYFQDGNHMAIGITFTMKREVDAEQAVREIRESLVGNTKFG